jgi:hypothetical protein
MKIIAPDQTRICRTSPRETFDNGLSPFCGAQVTLWFAAIICSPCSIGGGQAGLKKAGGGIFSPHLLQISALEKLTRLHFGHFRDCIV